jgi:hypothetical protein
MVQTPEQRACLQEEDVIVIDLPGGLERCSKAKMSSQHGQRTRTQLNTAIFARLGLIPVDARDSRFVNTDYSVHEIDVR